VIRAGGGTGFFGRRFRALRLALVVGAIFALGFAYGAVVGFYQVPPFGLVWQLDRIVREWGTPPDGEARYLEWAFRDPLPDGPLLNPPVRDLESLVDQLEEFAVVGNDGFFDAYQTIVVGALTSLGGELVQLDYSAMGKAAKAYAYFRKSRTGSNCAVLVIPESGHNKSSATLKSGVFGIADACDAYVLIKPNADYRAVHDGRHKLRREMFVLGLLRRGFSYSVTYLVEALALEKYIKGKYASRGVAGLSQGGEAALLVALQSKPDFAVVASGFSVLQRQVTMGEIDQIIIPGIYNVYTLDHLRGELARNQTRYLFTFGERESLYYGVDAAARKSCHFLDSIGSPGVACVIHGGAHEMPIEVVLPFIRNQAKPEARVAAPS